MSGSDRSHVRTVWLLLVQTTGLQETSCTRILGEDILRQLEVYSEDSEAIKMVVLIFAILLVARSYCTQQYTPLFRM